MTVELLVIGKTDSAEVGALVAMYSKRISHYLRFAITTLPDVRTTRSTTAQQQKSSDSAHPPALRLLTAHGTVGKSQSTRS